MIFSWFSRKLKKTREIKTGQKDVIQMSYVQELTERNEEDSFGRGRKTRVTTVIFFYRGRFDEFSAIQGMHHTLAVTRCIYTAAGLGPIRGFGTGGTLCRPRLKPKQEIEIPMFYNYLSQLLWTQLSSPRVCLPPLYEAEWLIESTVNVYSELRKAGWVSAFKPHVF